MSKTAAVRRNPEVWMSLALEILASEGVERVMVEPMARKLGVTKGSFYWHFKNRNDLLQQMVDHWAAEMTSLVIDKVATKDTPPQEKMLTLVEEISLKRRGRFDPAIRAWSKKDVMVEKTVRDIDKMRLTFLANLLEDAGFSEDDADIRARLLYGYMVGESSVLHNSNKFEQFESLKRMIDIVFASNQPVTET